MSDMMNIKMTPTCLKCGHQGIVIPDDPTDDSIIKCQSCGAELGTHGQFQAAVRAKAVEATKKAFQSTLKDVFRGSKHIKLKF